ncbi:enoyl-CoA hydratase/isomerase family protein [Cupriavidus pauculus]|uniref:enoyl-CoA hydratase/isomerase family protein n=1 Tax=Cupriavidus pauculus TaxID=82633 RepID=UPI001FD4C25B|nr:enoyl-CoA hydratase/isomerase family protein [Cupriavidus pauculus]
MNEYTLIQLAQRDGIAVLTLNRPDKRNTISDDMRTELIDALQRVAADRSVRALVLTGSGKGFCAGGDVAGMQRRMDAPPGEVGFNGWTRQQRVHHSVALLHDMPKPVIAAVNGGANGLGADLAMACDLVIAAPVASFAWSYIHRGLIPDGGGMYFLPRRVGLAQAKQLIFSGRKVEAAEALQLGIVDRLSASGDSLVDEAVAWAAEMAHGSATALALGKSILNQTFELTADQVFAQGSQAQGICYTSSAHRESVQAFLARAANKD